MHYFHPQNPPEPAESLQTRFDNLSKSIVAISDGDASQSLTISQWLIMQELKRKQSHPVQRVET